MKGQNVIVLWGLFRRALHYVLWVLFSNSGGYDCSPCASSSPGIVWNVRSLAPVPDGGKHSSGQGKKCVFKTDLRVCITVCCYVFLFYICVCVCVCVCVCRLNEVSHQSRHLTDKPRPRHARFSKPPTEKQRRGYNQPAVLQFQTVSHREIASW